MREQSECVAGLEIYAGRGGGGNGLGYLLHDDGHKHVNDAIAGNDDKCKNE